MSMFNKIDTFKGYNSHTYANDDGFILFNNPQNYNDTIKLRLTKFKKNCSNIDNVRDFSTDSITGNFDPDVVEINSELYVLLKSKKEGNNPHVITLMKFDNSYNFKWAININNNSKNLLSYTANLVRKGNLLFVVAADKNGNTAIICINPGSAFGSPVIASSRLIKGIKHGSSTFDQDGNLMLFSSDSLYAKIRINNQVIDTVVWAKKIKNRFFASVNDPLPVQSTTGFRVATVVIDTMLRHDKSVNQTGIDTAIYKLVSFDFDGNIKLESDGFIGPDYKVWPVEMKNNESADKSNLYIMTKNRVGFYTNDLKRTIDGKYYKFQKDTFDVVDAALEILDDKSLLMSGFSYKKAGNNEFNLLSPYLFVSKTQTSDKQFVVDAIQPVCLKDSTDKVKITMTTTQTGNLSLTDTLASFFITDQKFKTINIDNKKFHENKCGKVNMKKTEEDEVFCPGEEYRMSVEWLLWADYLWNTGEKTTFNTKNKKGIYTVKVSLCDTVKESKFEYILTDEVNRCFSVLIPEAFIPDDQNDSLNLVFKSYQEKPFNYAVFALQVFDRWGEKVFETQDPKTGWDGTFRGNPMPAGVYLYHLHWEAIFDEKKYENTHKGQILLLR